MAPQKPEPSHPEVVQLDDNCRLKNRCQTAEKLLLDIPESFGIRNLDVAQYLYGQTFSALATVGRSDPADIEELDKVALSVRLLVEMKPEGVLEAMLCNQMIATHDAAMAMMQAVPHRDGGIHRQESGLTNGAKLMKLFAEQVEVYQKLKGQGTQQRVTVEHVHIHEGGQAMVGNFEQPIGGRGRGDKEK
ncbi:hypothetical protein [Bryobacter aggregatus]|uniref:hypothetical protein n=1 Tax=Bryobacter aggregatus TaxID=360054 RepID=UPI000689259C|nr:hypothetical protein [Bryobacter aggregatus]